MVVWNLLIVHTLRHKCDIVQIVFRIIPQLFMRKKINIKYRCLCIIREWIQIHICQARPKRVFQKLSFLKILSPFIRFPTSVQIRSRDVEIKNNFNFSVKDINFGYKANLIIFNLRSVNLL